MSLERIVLMYITEVSGHHSATLAIERALKILSPSAEVININAFNYTNPISEKLINWIYMAVIKRFPQLWRYLYDNPKVVKRISGIRDVVNKFNAPKLKMLFDQFKPDVVLCSQAFPCGMVADFKKEYHSDIPLVAVLTDYVPHSFWLYEQVDYYVTPSAEVSARLMAKGVAGQKIKALGIPFDPKFNLPISKEEAAKNLGLNPAVFTVLIMGGGQGLGPINTIMQKLEELPGELQEIVVCGSNKKLYRRINKKIKKYKKKIVLFGYAVGVQELMSASDVIITKPGGITTAEATTKKLPMIIVKPIPGQEASNTTYLTQMQAAIKVEDPKDINLIVRGLMDNPRRLEELSFAAAATSKPNSTLDIAKLVLELAQPQGNV